jgi:hypothetical protein
MSTKSLMIAAAVGLATLAAGVGAADAHSMGNSMGMSMNKGMNSGMNSGTSHRDFFRHDHGLRIIVGSSYPDCSYLFDKWQLTGDFFWKKRFLQCKYGY